MKKLLTALERRAGGRATAVVLAAALLGVLVLAGPVLAEVVSNPDPISIPERGTATPYPASVDVSGLSGSVTDLNVTLKGVSHGWPDDIEALLVGPGGQKVMLMADVGGNNRIDGVDLTFDDEAARGLPDGAQIATGAYKPTQGTGGGDSITSPPGPYGSSLTAFDGTDPNGSYKLYVYDDARGDSGQIAGGFSVDITTGASPVPPTDKLPDLAMAQLENLQIQNTTDGRSLLRFSTVIVNTGAGSFQLHGSRPNTTSTEMTNVTQRIFNDAGGYRDRPTTATMYYSGDGHDHWHVKDLQDYALIRPDNGVKVGTGAKRGFCFYDNTNFGSSQSGTYNGCANNQPNALAVTMGLSRGWGDRYFVNLVDQYIDITGLSPGRYRLQVTADDANWFEESNETNNFTWVDIQISGSSVSVVQWGPAAQPISG